MLCLQASFATCCLQCSCRQSHVQRRAMHSLNQVILVQPGQPGQPGHAPGPFLDVLKLVIGEQEINPKPDAKLDKSTVCYQRHLFCALMLIILRG